MSKNIKLENGSAISDLTFDKSFNGKFDCFQGYYNGKFFGGNNESGNFKIGNYKDFGWNQIVVYVIENEVSKAFYSLNNKKPRQRKIKAVEV